MRAFRRFPVPDTADVWIGIDNYRRQNFLSRNLHGTIRGSAVKVRQTLSILVREISVYTDAP